MQFKPTRPADRRAGFTLAEVLAALLFMAIVIPVAVEGVRVASLAGQVGERKAAAARIAGRVLNEITATGQWKDAGSGGTLVDGPHEYHWRASNAAWTESGIQTVTVEVAFTVQGQPYDVSLSTLVDNTLQ
jgi:type II secretory pathway pseudopilin PulG